MPETRKVVEYGPWMDNDRNLCSKASMLCNAGKDRHHDVCHTGIVELGGNGTGWSNVSWWNARLQLRDINDGHLTK